MPALRQAQEGRGGRAAPWSNGIAVCALLVGYPPLSAFADISPSRGEIRPRWRMRSFRMHPKQRYLEFQRLSASVLAGTPLLSTRHARRPRGRPRPISPREGEMPGRAEGGARRPARSPITPDPAYTRCRAASSRMRWIIERRPLARWAERCSIRPRRVNRSMASKATISEACLPE